MSASAGTLQLPVRTNAWKAWAIVLLAAMLLGTAGYAVGRTVSSSSTATTTPAVTRTRQAPSVGIENPTEFGHWSNPSMADNPELAVPPPGAFAGGTDAPSMADNPELAVPHPVIATTGTADSRSCEGVGFRAC
jgi:hypothetical protein